jgi:hypothetical protein
MKNSAELSDLDYLPTKQKMRNISRTQTREPLVSWGPSNDTKIDCKRALSDGQWLKTHKEGVHPPPKTQHIKYIQNDMVDASHLFRP